MNNLIKYLDLDELKNVKQLPLILIGFVFLAMLILSIAAGFNFGLIGFMLFIALTIFIVTIIVSLTLYG